MTSSYLLEKFERTTIDDGDRYVFLFLMADQPNSFPPTTFNSGQPKKKKKKHNDKERASVKRQIASRWIHPPAVSRQVNHIQNAPNCNRLKSIKMSTIGVNGGGGGG